MITLFIDNLPVTVPENTSILEAARAAGVEIPHFCYHPGLPTDGNCRLCTVEVETPRGRTTLISCATPVAEGMKVLTQTDTVKEIRRAVLEFFLANHPLDCPICDKAGECLLQDHYYDHARHDSVLDTGKVRKGKKIDLGPKIVLDQERCVLCNRCARFLRDFAGQEELYIAQRGDHSRITAFPGTILTGRYLLNTVDLCPVGALTSRDFRFACREWFLRRTATVCPGCARGCHVWLDYHPEQGKAYRVLPRLQPEINRHWMCDEGRLTYRAVNDNRLPPEKAAPALKEAAALLSETLARHGPDAIAAVSSPFATNEAQAMFALFLDALGCHSCCGGNYAPDGFGDPILILPDKSPNAAGLASLGVLQDPAALLNAAGNGKIKLLLVLTNDFLPHLPESARGVLMKIPTRVAIAPAATATTAAMTLTIPCAAFAEQDGTFTNSQGQLSRLVAAPGLNPAYQPEWRLLAELARRLKRTPALSTLAELRREMSRRYAPYREVAWEKLPAPAMPRNGLSARGWPEC